MDYNQLYLRKVILNRSKVKDFNTYPFNIPIIKNFHELSFKTPVTFLVGENGVGKSTLMEAIAIAIGLAGEGGTQNFLYSNKNTISDLSSYLILHKGINPKTKFFLRAESFYNFATEVQRLAEEDGYSKLYDYYGGNLHQCSHGESFLQLVENRFTDHGFYILDEPEAALSPQRQLSLLYLIDDLVKKGSQFIIATHSPILISYRNGTVLNLNNNLEEINYKETEIYKIYKMYLDNPDGMQEKLFQEES